MRTMIGVLLVSSLFGQPPGVVAAPADAAQSTTDGFSGLTTGRTVVVTDDSGTETKGRLRFVTPDSLTMAVDGKDRQVERRDVRTVSERGDSVKNGMLIGLSAGAALGIVTGAASTDCGGFFSPVTECSAGDKARIAAVGAGVFGAIGAGIGAGIDALITRQRLVYTRREGAVPHVLAIMPSWSRSSAVLRVAMAW